MTEPNYTLLPDHMRPGMQRWIEQGVIAGDFMMAVLRNEFADAVTRADAVNRYTLVNYAFFLFTCPSAAWGSAEKVETWARHRGLAGKENAVAEG